MIEVNFWGSHPDECNDDCVTGKDFDNLVEATNEFNKPIILPYLNRSVAYIQMVGDNVNLVRKNPDYVYIPDDYSDWKNEYAMQSGMMGGCQAYNDAMGY